MPYLNYWPTLHESVGGIILRRSHTNTWCDIQLKFDKPVMCWQVFALKVRNPGCLFIKKSKPNRLYSFWWAWILKQADALKVCPIPDACLLVMAQRPARLLGLPETRSLIFLIKNSPDQAEGYLAVYIYGVALCCIWHRKLIRHLLQNG